MIDRLSYPTDWIRLDFTLDPGGDFSTSSEPVEVLIEAMRIGYLGGRQTLEKFELAIDAILRYADRINFTRTTASLGLEADEVAPYVSLLGR